MHRLLALSIMLLTSACAEVRDSAEDRLASSDSRNLNGIQTADDAPPAAPSIEESARRVQTDGLNTPVADLPFNMPQSLRGSWRVDDLDRVPTAEDCNQTSSSNRNFGKVLTIRADRFTLFEDGGRLITVHTRSNERIDATFDTTYADTPTQARIAFMTGPADLMNVTANDGSAPMAATAYRRCPV